MGDQRGDSLRKKPRQNSAVHPPKVGPECALLKLKHELNRTVALLDLASHDSRATADLDGRGDGLRNLSARQIETVLEAWFTAANERERMLTHPFWKPPISGNALDNLQIEIAHTTTLLELVTNENAARKAATENEPDCTLADGLRSLAYLQIKAVNDAWFLAAEEWAAVRASESATKIVPAQ